MTNRCGHASQASHRLVKETQLAQHSATIVVDALGRQSIVCIELKNTAKPKLYVPSSGWQPAPRTKMSACNRHFYYHAISCDVPALNFNFQIRQRVHQFAVVSPHTIVTIAMICPRFVVVTGILAEVAITASRSCRLSQRICSSTMLMRIRRRSGSTNDMALLNQCKSPRSPRYRSSWVFVFDSWIASATVDKQGSTK